MIAAILLASAASTCPANTGAVHRSMAELHERFAEADERWGSQYTPRLAAQARLDAIKNRREALAARLKLGYAQLDAGCKAEAKKTFEGVWAWNGSDYADFGAQAREALNALRAGG